MRGRAAVALAAAALLVCGACGGGGDGEEASGGSGDDSRPADLRVIAKEYRFEPAALAIDAGKPYVLEVENIGSIPHDLSVRKGGFKLTVQRGKTGRKTLEIEEPGTYEIYCSLPGHKSAGMDGELTVR